ncbi:putative bifunctional diguanylate cyclase/phosphodiesterase [Novosphingobium mangrovi (ex Huang et al. 2023)]|uniref:EAL domain-containing protein n=1 Tax=Novosphingobium mangrovi (ex Huang et al. 2023) TaxID=2976432 RepID=A0ABT2I4V0_9SPHN|nr:GGDEF domain-containing response regulator [Novosphingobium mangrovi (ex Huang et al. 2023)]MCT2399832.1 EAL domain-containing protein [Novosphingobium mangrovi (ex Huang et al. 2023)]
MDNQGNGNTELFALIVDDDDVDRERLARMLERSSRSIHVVEATSQAEALELIRGPAPHFDIVFLDFGLEDGDGRDLVPTIHGEIDPDCPIIAVTGFADELVAAASIKSGMSEFLTKRSLSPERVAASVEEAIAWRSCRQELRRTEEELTHRSLHDPLTDLPNRTLFFDRLGQNCARAKRSGDPFAVVMVDLDRFKEINDTFGHAAGDAVLTTIGRRLRANLREVDTVARLGGDEFALLLQNVSTDDAAMTMAKKLAALIEQPIVHEGRALHVGCSIGIALCPQFGLSPAGLVSVADDAMYEAKRGTDTAVVARRSGQRRINLFDRSGLLEELEEALIDGSLQWHWQPKIDMRDSRVLGFEALVRWRDPRGNDVPADHLIQTVEQSPLLEDFTYHSLDRVLEQFAALQGALGHATICINISARMLERSGFVDKVTECIARHGVDPLRVTLELTETALIANPGQAKRVIEQLQDRQVGLSIDDFGAGFTSFGYLREFAVSEIKIDRSYIRRFAESRFDQSLVNSLVVLCESLGIPLVAEGVEDARTRDLLVSLGCHAGQGYGICRPMPYDDVRHWIERWNGLQSAA